MYWFGMIHLLLSFSIANSSLPTPYYRKSLLITAGYEQCVPISVREKGPSAASKMEENCCDKPALVSSNYQTAESDTYNKIIK